MPPRDSSDPTHAAPPAPGKKKKAFRSNHTMRTSASAPFLPIVRKNTTSSSSSSSQRQHQNIYGNGSSSSSSSSSRPPRGAGTGVFSSLSRARPTRSARLLFQKTTYLHVFILPALLLLIIEMFPPMPHMAPSSPSAVFHNADLNLNLNLNPMPRLHPHIIRPSSLLPSAMSITKRSATPPPAFPSSTQPGNSIVAVCMNRHETLHRTLPSWQRVYNVSEIVIVDWSSSPSLLTVVQSAMDSDPRVRMVRADNETEWVLTRAYNLAMSAASYDRVIRTDCDYSLQPNFLAAHPDNDAAFYAGNYASARDPNEAHLNGAVLIRRADFFAVGGYDERIQTYGWDDEDLYVRLQEMRNLSKLNVSFDHVGHVKHTDGSRAQRDVKFVQVEIDLNSLLLKPLGKWNATFGQRALRQWSVLRPSSSRKQQQAIVTTVSASLSGLKPKPLKSLVSQHEYEEAWKLALGQRLANDYKMPWDIMETMPSSTRRLLLSKLNERMARRKAALNSSVEDTEPPPPRMLFVHCMHGLGNRLRALASAMSFANATDRELVVIWEKDAHIAAFFEDLFVADDVVVMSHLKPKWPFAGYEQWDRSWETFRFYNYMEMEGNGAVKGAKIADEPGKHLYFKSAYIIRVSEPQDSHLTNWEQDNRMLRSLTPVPEVVSAVRAHEANGISNMVGIHIRDRTLKRDIKNVDFGSEYGPSASTEMQYWREKSSYRNFIAEMWRMVEREPDLKFYIATDTVSLFETLQTKFPDRVVFTPRQCDGRDGTCIRFALIDLLCLARTKALVGSNWSSFTEAASRFGGKAPRLSGVDFAKELPHANTQQRS